MDALRESISKEQRNADRAMETGLPKAAGHLNASRAMQLGKLEVNNFIKLANSFSSKKCNQCMGLGYIIKTPCG